MRILFIGDPHIKGQDISTLKQKVLLESKNVDMVCILGDILDSKKNVNVYFMNQAIDLFKGISLLKPLIVIVGNHDMCDQKDFLSDKHWMTAVKYMPNITVVDKVCHISKGIVAVPYVCNGRFLEALNTNKNIKLEETSLIICHQEFFDSKHGAYVSTTGDKWDEKLPFVISGHVHERQYIGKNIYYPGSCFQHRYGDKSRRILAVYDTETKNIEEISISLDLKKIKTQYISIYDFKRLSFKDNPDFDLKIVIKSLKEDFNRLKETKKFRDVSFFAKISHRDLKKFL